MTDLKNSKDVKAAIKQEERDQDSQERLQEQFNSIRAGLFGRDTDPEAAQNVSAFIGRLKKTADEKNNTSERLVAKRTLLGFSILLSEESASFMATRNYESAAIDLLTATQIQPDNPRLFYGAARAYSLARNKKKSIEALKKAVDKGYSDFNQSENNKDFDFIREEADFKSLVAALKGKQH